MFKVKSEIIYLDKCFIPGMILALESPPQIGRIFLLVSISFVLLVLIDNKIMFRNVLFLERNLRHGKYSRYVSNNQALIKRKYLLNCPKLYILLKVRLLGTLWVPDVHFCGESGHVLHADNHYSYQNEGCQN